MPNPTPELAPPAATPNVELVQETRLAVVMYGGVSLAIYINGIAQELLRLVRATAPAASDPTRPHLPQHELTSTEPIYRLLGQVSHGIGLGRPTASGAPTLDQILAHPEDHPIRTRFVVDVLSGTSAGGLNAVYLAKALANDQSLEGLKRLWISDGDVKTLLNDRASIEGFSHLSVQRPPRSLLNSERMYLLLLSALDQMRSDRPADATSPYADELDLFVTTTDIVGYPVRLDLGDHTVDERRHRHVFHMRYAAPETGGGEPKAAGSAPAPPRPASTAGSTAPDLRAETARDLEHGVRNDFRDAQNRFLAFVARCTSSFPFAFEAATLEDLDPLLYRSRRDFEKDIGNWERFFGRHLRGGGGDFGVRAPDPTDACLRAYSDGGILDNRPFSYATDALMRRTSSVPVDRKLLYLEPVPRHNAPDSREKPDALTTALLALTSVPGYESIRADLERVIDRNRSILRLRDVHRMVEQDLRDATDADLALLGSEGFEDLAVSELRRRHGPAYGPYHRLKIATLSDEFSVVVSRALGFGDFDVERAAIGYLVRAWVRRRYPEVPPLATTANPAPGGTQPQLLKRFDVSYRLRRLRFLRLRIRELNALDDNAIAILKPWLPPELFAEFRDERDAPGMAREVRAALREIAGSIDRAYARLRATGRALRTPVNTRAEGGPPPDVPPENRTHRLAVTIARWEIAEALRGAQVTGKELRNLMRLAERDRDELADEVVARPSSVQALDALEFALRKVLAFETGEAKQVVRTALDAAGPGLSPVQRGLRGLLLRYYDTYQAYDFATLPFTWGTEIGEADFVDIVRVSPEDSRSLIDELQDRAAEELLEGRLSGRSDRLRRKLAGNQLANFGAFLDELWRRNDMMWGRLDAAEQIVDMTLPANSPEGVELKRRAFREILREDLPPQDRVRLMALLARAHGKSKVTRDDIPGILERLVGQKQDDKLKEVLRAVVGPDFLLDYVRKDYEVEREFEARQSLRVLARALRISGDLFRSLADRRRLNGRPFSVLTSAGVGLWGLIEVTVPRSFASILVRYWMWLLLLAAGILYAAGVFRDDDSLRDTGLGTIGVLAAVGLLVVLVQNLLERRKAWIGWSIYAAVVLGGLFAVFGFLGDTPIPLAHPFGGTLALEGRALAFAGFGLLLFAFLKEPSTRGERQRYDWVRWSLYGIALALAAFGWATLQRDQGVRLVGQGERLAASGAWIVVIVALFAMAFPLLYPLRQLYDKAAAWPSSRARSRGTRRKPPARDRDAA